jgi:uncharacterized protein (DUF924 family)
MTDGVKASSLAVRPNDIHRFWFQDCLTCPQELENRKADWFGGGKSFDDTIRRAYCDLPDRALNDEFDHWQKDPLSVISLILILDQFPRNMYRGTARSFAYDDKARLVAQAAIDLGIDGKVHPLEATFIYLPFEHSEDPRDQVTSVGLFERLAQTAPTEFREHLESAVEYARKHQDILSRFSRFPHRNQALGRSTTAAEQAYLNSGGDTFGVPQK